MKISIIIPCYNEEKYISACLDSVLTQNYPKDTMEILVVDGMSTDQTRSIVAQYCREYPFFTLLDNPQKIVPYALNYGINKWFKKKIL